MRSFLQAPSLLCPKMDKNLLIWDLSVNSRVLSCCLKCSLLMGTFPWLLSVSAYMPQQLLACNAPFQLLGWLQLPTFCSCCLEMTPSLERKVWVISMFTDAFYHLLLQIYTFFFFFSNSGVQNQKCEVMAFVLVISFLLEQNAAPQVFFPHVTQLKIA